MKSVMAQRARVVCMLLDMRQKIYSNRVRSNNKICYKYFCLRCEKNHKLKTNTDVRSS